VEDVKKLLAEQQQKYEKQLKDERDLAAKKEGDLKTKLVKQNIDNKLRRLALESGTLAEKVDQVILLLKNSEVTGYVVSLNDAGEIEFQKPDGTTALDDKGALMTPENYVAQFLAGNKHFLRAEARDGGAGFIGGDITKRGGKRQLKPSQIKAAVQAGLDPAKVEEHQQDHIKP
jgi:hypothetical protein